MLLIKKVCDDLEENVKKGYTLEAQLAQALEQENIIGARRYYEMLKEQRDLNIQLVDLIDNYSMLN